MFTKVRVATNRDCQLNCTYCPHGKKIFMENYDNEDKYCLTTEEFFSIIKVMIKCGVSNVHFTGGEPTRTKDIITMVKEVKLSGAKVELNTNGIGLNKSFVTKLKEAGLTFLKISLDTVDSNYFFQITGVDCFDAVIKGIKETLTIMPVRLNCVVMRSNKESIINLLKVSNDLGVQQIHLLDLTYYPDCKNKKNFWENEFVYLTKEVMPLIENNFNCTFKLADIFGCRFYEAQPFINGLKVVLKEAQPTMRVVSCFSCDEYCHEGIFTLRLSCNGYLNFCPAKNSFGINALQALKEGKLEETLYHYSEIFDRAVETNSFSVFLKINDLNYQL